MECSHTSYRVEKSGFASVFLIAVIIGVVRGGPVFIDTSGGRLPVQEIREAAEFVEGVSDPAQQIFALEALAVVYEAGRKTLPNMSMAQFSYYPAETAEFQKYNLINDQITLNYFEQAVPAVVIFNRPGLGNLAAIGQIPGNYCRA